MCHIYPVTIQLQIDYNLIHDLNYLRFLTDSIWDGQLWVHAREIVLCAFFFSVVGD